MLKPRLWVDYTNHRGHRAWREIVVVYDVRATTYPPNDPKAEVKLCLKVKLADRTDARILALTSCHAFVESETRPKTRPEIVENFMQREFELACVYGVSARIYPLTRVDKVEKQDVPEPAPLSLFLRVKRIEQELGL